MDQPSGHPTHESLAAGYLRCARSLRCDYDPDGIWSPETDPDQAAYDAVDRLVRGGAAEDAWAVVLEVLRQAPDEELAGAAVGTLEPLLQRRGTEFVGLVEGAAAEDERFRWALGRIWLDHGDMPPEALARIVAASGGAIRPSGGARQQRDLAT